MTSKTSRPRVTATPQERAKTFQDTLRRVSIRLSRTDTRLDTTPLAETIQDGLIKCAKHSGCKSKRIWAVSELSEDIGALMDVAMRSRYADSATLAVEKIAGCGNPDEIHSTLVYIIFSSRQYDAIRRAMEFMDDEMRRSIISVQKEHADGTWPAEPLFPEMKKISSGGI